MRLYNCLSRKVIIRFNLNLSLHNTLCRRQPFRNRSTNLSLNRNRRRSLLSTSLFPPIPQIHRRLRSLTNTNTNNRTTNNRRSRTNPSPNLRTTNRRSHSNSLTNRTNSMHKRSQIRQTRIQTPLERIVLNHKPIQLTIPQIIQTLNKRSKQPIQIQNLRRRTKQTQSLKLTLLNIHQLNITRRLTHRLQNKRIPASLNQLFHKHCHRQTLLIPACNHRQNPCRILNYQHPKHFKNRLGMPRIHHRLDRRPLHSPATYRNNLVQQSQSIAKRTLTLTSNPLNRSIFKLYPLTHQNSRNPLLRKRCGNLLQMKHLTPALDRLRHLMQLSRRKNKNNVLWRLL